MTRGDRRGQSLVEFALVLPLFIIILVGIFDFGRAIFAYSTLNNASREAARQAVVDQTLVHIEDAAIAGAVSLTLERTDVQVDYRDAATPDAARTCDAHLASPQIVGLRCRRPPRAHLRRRRTTPVGHRRPDLAQRREPLSRPPRLPGADKVGVPAWRLIMTTIRERIAPATPRGTSARGQILVIVAAGLLVVIAMVGLIVDGGIRLGSTAEDAERRGRRGDGRDGGDPGIPG